MAVFHVLGPLEVHDGQGVPVPVPRQKQREILALLLFRAGETVSPETMIDALWGERPPASARANVQSYVSGLRSVIARAVPGGGGQLCSGRGGYRLALLPGQYDAADFDSLLSGGRGALAAGRLAFGAERLARALAMWRGDALSGLRTNGWPEPYVSRLDQARLAAMEERAEALMRLGAYTELIEELTLATARHPLRERLWDYCIAGLHRTGRRAEALRMYRTLTGNLSAELGVAPSFDPPVSAPPHGVS